MSGLEPPTSSLRTKRSSRLSYTPVAGRSSYRRRLRLLRWVAAGAGGPNLPRVRRIPDLWWNILGYALWATGCLLFAVAAARAGDRLSLVAGLLFLVGVLVVIGPLMRTSGRHERGGD